MTNAAEPAASAAGVDSRALAEQVRAACIEAAVLAWEDAGLQGLCAEGRWEAAVGAMRSLRLPPPPEPAAEGTAFGQR